MRAFCRMSHLQATSMNFKRNDVQEFIETDLGCCNLSIWPSYKSALEKWSITSLNINHIRDCVNSDIQSYFLKAFQSFSQALHEIADKKYAWSIVKLYYCIFYLLRCEILLSNHIIIRCKSLYYTQVKLGGSPVVLAPKKFKGDHQLSIALAERLYNQSELNDPILGNKIDGENVYMWFMSHRDRVNYQMKDFSDPQCDPALQHIILYFNENKLLDLFKYYSLCPDFSICFDKDHTLLSVPYLKLVSIYKRISSNLVLSYKAKVKIVDSLNLLLDLGITKRDIQALIQ